MGTHTLLHTNTHTKAALTRAFKAPIDSAIFKREKKKHFKTVITADDMAQQSVAVRSALITGY